MILIVLFYYQVRGAAIASIVPVAQEISNSIFYFLQVPFLSYFLFAIDLIFILDMNVGNELVFTSVVSSVVIYLSLFSFLYLYYLSSIIFFSYFLVFLFIVNSSLTLYCHFFGLNFWLGVRWLGIYLWQCTKTPVVSLWFGFISYALIYFFLILIVLFSFLILFSFLVLFSSLFDWFCSSQKTCIMA